MQKKETCLSLNVPYQLIHNTGLLPWVVFFNLVCVVVFCTEKDHSFINEQNFIFYFNFFYNAVNAKKKSVVMKAVVWAWELCFEREQLLVGLQGRYEIAGECLVAQPEEVTHPFCSTYCILIKVNTTRMSCSVQDTQVLHSLLEIGMVIDIYTHWFPHLSEKRLSSITNFYTVRSLCAGFTWQKSKKWFGWMCRLWTMLVSNATSSHLL